jgi:hypothetical protein
MNDDVLRKYCVDLIARVGLAAAARMLDVNGPTLARYIAGAKTHRGTLAIIGDAVGRMWVEEDLG